MMKNKQKVGVFVNQPECSIQSAHGVMRALASRYTVEFIVQESLQEKYLRRYDMIVFPGGIGDSNTWHSIVEPYSDEILTQLQRGCRYLGICMGAYWAGRHYFNILKNNIEPVQYIRTEHAEIRRSYSTVAQIQWQNQQEHMFFYDGCAFLNANNNNNNNKNCHVIATYKNGHAAAIVQNNLGLIGPHPESDIYWYNRQYLKAHWHDYRHHALLLAMVDRMFDCDKY